MNLPGNLPLTMPINASVLIDTLALPTCSKNKLNIYSYLKIKDDDQK